MTRTTRVKILAIEFSLQTILAANNEHSPHQSYTPRTANLNIEKIAQSIDITQLFKFKDATYSNYQ
jgi:hypothetical protein